MLDPLCLGPTGLDDKVPILGGDMAAVVVLQGRIHFCGTIFGRPSRVRAIPEGTLLVLEFI